MYIHTYLGIERDKITNASKPKPHTKNLHWVNFRKLGSPSEFRHCVKKVKVSEMYVSSQVQSKQENIPCFLKGEQKDAKYPNLRSIQ